MRISQWALPLALCLLPVAVFAAEEGGTPPTRGEPAAGKELAQQGHPDKSAVMPCQSCHGAQGEGNAQAGFPRLAGLSPGYMVGQLRDFASGDRGNHPTMISIAKALSEQEMWDVSAYYADQEVELGSAEELSEEQQRTGERLALRGRAEEAVPACAACHGPQGRGLPPQFPRIGGQHAAYLEKQLTDFAEGNRANDASAMMRAIAGKLSAEDMEAVSAYFRRVGGEQGNP